MSRTFSIPLSESPASLLAKAQAAAVQAGADFEGNTTCGSFSGKGVSGDYTICEDRVIVRITVKPFLAPWSVVESRVRAFFGGPAAALSLAAQHIQHVVLGHPRA